MLSVLDFDKNAKHYMQILISLVFFLTQSMCKDIESINKS